jgi:HK97 family phage major capsid protein
MRGKNSEKPFRKGEKDETKMQVSNEVAQVLANVLQERFGFATVSQLDRAVADVLKKTNERMANGPRFSLSTMIRGLAALHRQPLVPATAEADASYVKALSTGSTPGSYLVPTMQADEIIGYLNTGGIARSMGVRIWPMNGIQKMNVPSALAAPAWVWMAQNSVQQATDPNLGQLSFDLKERRALIAIPNQLLATSVPALDTLLSELIGLGAAEHEDTAFFATGTVSGGPTALQAAASITQLNCASSANGGNLGYVDIIACLAKAAAVKAKGPFVWACSPRTFYSRILGMLDLSSRPIVVPTLTTGLAGAVPFTLFGWPVFVTPFLLENQALGSGSNQSTLIFTNPKYCHIAADGDIQIAISTERFFDASQTAIRAVQHEDFGYAPPQGIIALGGIN